MVRREAGGGGRDVTWSPDNVRWEMDREDPHLPSLEVAVQYRGRGRERAGGGGRGVQQNTRKAPRKRENERKARAQKTGSN